MATKRDFMLFLSSILLNLLFCPDGLNTTTIRTNDPEDIGTTQIDESIIRAYWDPDNCGANGPNYNRNWCNKDTRVCPTEISTELCQHGSAYRTKTLLDATINNCTYVFYAEYTCQGIDANEIIGRWIMKDGDGIITCEKSGTSKRGLMFECGNNAVLDGKEVFEVEWQNNIYYMFDENDHLTASGAITNAFLTWSPINFNKWMYWNRVATEHPPSDVLLGMISTSMVLSEGEHQKAVCARNPESITFDDKYIIDKDHRTMDHVGPVGDMKYCEVRGAFVFYSEEDYKGYIKHAAYGTKAMVKDMDPKDSILNRIQSVRIAGNREKWDADTITFYEGEDFSGHPEMFDDVVSSSSLDNPGSAIVTGRSESPWHVYAENGKCYELNVFDARDGIARFYRSLKQELTFGSNIERVEKGFCPPEFK